MKNLIIFATLIILSLFLISCALEDVDPAYNNSDWQVIDIDYQGTLSDIKFVSADTGFAFGNDPDVLLKTVDGGNSWEILPFPASIQGTLMSFYPVTSKIIIAARDTLFRSSDGGSTWTKLSTIDRSSILQFEFTSSTVGYACTVNGVYKTTDTGESWRLVKQKSQGYDAIQFVDASTGFASGGSLVELNADKILATYGVLTKTDDGGETWVDLDKGDWSTKSQNFKKITAIDFIDAHYGYVTTFENELLRTTDGGHTWEIVNNKNILDPYSIPVFYTKETGFLKSGKTIFRTEDGGKTLLKDYYKEQQEIINLYSTPDHKIFAVGRAGLLMKRK